jgi:hypothetical protein
MLVDFFMLMMYTCYIGLVVGKAGCFGAAENFIMYVECVEVQGK